MLSYMNCIDCNLNFNSKEDLVKHFYTEEHQENRKEDESDDEEEDNRGSNILLREQCELVDELDKHYRTFNTGTSIEGYSKVRLMLSNLKRQEKLRHALIIRYMDDNGIKRGNNKKCRCGKEFEYTENLINHQIKCEYIQNCICNLCGKTFADQYILKTHMKKCIPKVDKEFKCDYCPRSYSDNGSLNRHLKKCKKKPDIIIKEIIKKEFECEFCDKSYNTIYSLQRHHHKECKNKPIKEIIKKEFACEFCPKSYGDKGSLNRHLKKCTEFKEICIELEKEEKEELEAF